MLLMKNPQFWSNLAHTLLILPTNELIILTKFHENCSKIEGFLLMPHFQASLIFFGTVSSTHFSEGHGHILAMWVAWGRVGFYVHRYTQLSFGTWLLAHVWSMIYLLRLPIHYAAEFGSFEVAYELLEKNSEEQIDAQTVMGM